MKNAAKNLVIAVLKWQVRLIYKRGDFKTIAVVGSIGKTSTKLAIAQVLGQKYKVRYQEGNYNDFVTVPLVFFGKNNPPRLTNPLSWLFIFLSNQWQLITKFKYDFVVLELGVDGPGQLEKFADYLKVDLAVITATTPEHMEFFKDVKQVAEEEFSVQNFSDELLISADFVDKAHMHLARKPYESYGIENEAKYKLVIERFALQKVKFKIEHNGHKFLNSETSVVSELQLYPILCASSVGEIFGLMSDEIKPVISNLRSVPGRMNLLDGKNGSLIIDETYNSSPDACLAALDTLYKLKAPQRIAILGNMNELGVLSPKYHEQVGVYCDPKKLELIVTIGPEANQYLAPAAKKQGCNVKTFSDSAQAGRYIIPKLKKNAIILAKGSQNGVYAEEAIKQLLKNPSDVKHLVRQSKHWLKKKARATKN